MQSARGCKVVNDRNDRTRPKPARTGAQHHDVSLGVSLAWAIYCQLLSVQAAAFLWLHR